MRGYYFAIVYFRTPTPVHDVDWQRCALIAISLIKPIVQQRRVTSISATDLSPAERLISVFYFRRASGDLTGFRFSSFAAALVASE